MTSEDLAQIVRLQTQFAIALDFGDVDAWVNCFTPDGVMVADGPSQARSEGPLVGARWEGTEQLRSLATSSFAGSHGRVRHWNGPGLVEGDGSAATMQSYLMIVWAGQEKSAGVKMTGTYFDRLRKVSGSWRFAERHMVADQDT
jgi:hypothetical protein